ncbi:MULTISPECIES: zinc ribbon domain-containing protein [unclassified Solwaraspora]|uniref:zinc ribbon domain-containing protein n=1 Tax=unclassified Solwaraspora TaxID=2627926 RepID=UPI00248CBE49|nr:MULTISPECIES: zinc ribbon domain-containing protein [unclassified Solwaraspora]WBB99876.1 zinc ribbon domain-containing protein [Solwaraspora sp. WMMA2059]WBC21576.1 zinc ribbon domain-containing protein [Solwaraspora sp. WMMA2080]WJK36387.1 zinc ribbon domain-containing protein [Solwaraspora sp. WMMA2065]
MPDQPGIDGYAVHLPAYALHDNRLDATGPPRPGGPVRGVAAFDEDAVTMAVEAMRHLTAADHAGRQLLLATTSAPYEAKTSAGVVHAALGLDPAVSAVDLRGHRCGATALNLVACSGDAAVLADLRTTRPGAPDELAQGDGAAAFVGGGTRAATLLARAGHTTEILERWRLPGERHDRVWDERFTADVLVTAGLDAARRAFALAGLDAVDEVVVSSSNTRAAAALRRTLGGSGADAKVERATGFTGAAHPALLLAAAFDEARPGRTILLLSATEGADAFVWRVGDGVREARGGPAVRQQLAARQPVGYGRYLRWRGLLDVQGPARPASPAPASPPMFRRSGWKFRLEGSRCDACAKVTTPPARVCASCGSAASGQTPATVPLRDKSARVVSVTRDHLTTMPEPEVAVVVADIDGGGRLSAYATDVAPGDVAVGMVMTPTFRRLWTTDSIPNYFWKLRPRKETTDGQ